jgi:hypothetical protein
MKYWGCMKQAIPVQFDLVPNILPFFQGPLKNREKSLHLTAIAGKYFFDITAGATLCGQKDMNPYSQKEE